MVERAHHHVLWTRIPDYKPEHLSQLVREKHAFEYWFHAASFLPMGDYRFALRRMAAVRRGDIRWYRADAKAMKHVLDRIRGEGPLRARDFESPKKKAGSWWNWKPMKQALEQLFMQGDLMVGMEKIYDLTERVLPDHVSTTEPTLEEFAEHLVEGALRANGVTTVKQITHLRSGADLRESVRGVLAARMDAGSVEEFQVEGKRGYFAPAGFADARTKAPGPNVRLLSPFDNGIIHRDRMSELFGFDYTLECYLPANKRQYGYFCLPILYGETIVGRVDCKAHRKEVDLELIHLHLENKDAVGEAFLTRLAKAMQRFAKFNGCETVRVTKTSPARYLKPFRASLTG